MRIILTLTDGTLHTVHVPYESGLTLRARLPEALGFVDALLGADRLDRTIAMSYEDHRGEEYGISVEEFCMARQAYGIRLKWTRYLVEFYNEDRSRCTKEYVVGRNPRQALLDAQVVANLSGKPRDRINQHIYTIFVQNNTGGYDLVGDQNFYTTGSAYRVPVYRSTVFCSVLTYTRLGWVETHTTVNQRGSIPVAGTIAFKYAGSDNWLVRTSEDSRVGTLQQWMYGVVRSLVALRRAPRIRLADSVYGVSHPSTGQFVEFYGENASDAAINCKLYYGQFMPSTAVSDAQMIYLEYVTSYDYNADLDWINDRTRERNREIDRRVQEILYPNDTPNLEQIIESYTRSQRPPERPAPLRREPPRALWVPTSNPQPLAVSTVPQMQLPLEMPNRRFGIEIEFDPGNHTQQEYQQAIDSVLRRQLNTRVMCFGYHHSNGGTWDLKTDSSCGFELATPALRWNQWPVVEAILAAIRNVGGVATSNCGVHIHHEFNDVRVTGLRRMYLLWYAYEDLLFKMVHPSRITNYYCAPIRQYGSFDTLRQRMGTGASIQQVSRTLGKYRSLNTLPWWNGARVEVRMHHGTLDAEDVKFWTAITQQMVERSRMVQTYAPLQEIAEMSIDEQLVRLKRRYSLDQVLNPAIDAAMQRGVQNA